MKTNKLMKKQTDGLSNIISRSLAALTSFMKCKKLIKKQYEGLVNVMDGSVAGLTSLIYVEGYGNNILAGSIEGLKVLSSLKGTDPDKTVTFFSQTKTEEDELGKKQTDGLGNAISGPVEVLTSFPSMDCHSNPLSGLIPLTYVESGIHNPLSELTPLTYVECHGNTSTGSKKGLRIMKKDELIKKQSELIDMQGMFISYFKKYSGDSERIDRFSKQIDKIQEEIASLTGKPEKL